MADRVDISAVARVIDQASGPIRAIQGAIGKTAQTAKIAGASIQGAIGKAATAARSAAASFVRLGTVGAFGGLAANFRNVGAAVSRFGGQLRDLATRAAQFAGIAGIAGIGGVIASVKSYIETAGGLVSTSQRLGVSAENLQKFHFAAEQTGLSAEGLEGGLSKFQRTLAGLARGGKDTAKVIPLLSKFGITLADIKAGDISAMLPKIASGFQKNTSALTRNAMATALFGKSGAELINFLSQGGEEMTRLGEIAVKLGIITNQEAADANKAGDQWKQFQRAATGVRNALAAELLPAIQPIVVALTEWIAANREWLRTKIHDAVQGLIEIFKELRLSFAGIDWTAFGRGLRDFGSAILWIVNLMGGWRNALIGLVLFINRGLIGSLLSVGLALGKLALSALALNPLTLAIGALAAGAYLIYRNWGTIGPWFNRNMATVKSALQDAWSAVKGWAQQSAAEIKSAFQTGGVAVGIKATVDALKTGVVGAYGWIRDSLAAIDWAAAGELAGRVLAAGWRATVELGQWLVEQLRAIDWAALGRSAATALAAAWRNAVQLGSWLVEQLRAIDWAAAGATAGEVLAAGWRGVVEIGKWLGEQIVNLDWAGLGYTAGQMLGQAIVAMFKAAVTLAEWLGTLDWEEVGKTAGRLIGLAILGALVATFHIGQWLIGLDWGAITVTILKFFESLVRNFVTIGFNLLSGLIQGMLDAIPGLSRVTGAIGAAFRLPGQVGDWLFGRGEPATAAADEAPVARRRDEATAQPGAVVEPGQATTPAPLAPWGPRPLLAAAASQQPSLVQQQAAVAQAAPPQKNEIEQRLKVDLSPDLRATLQSERNRGPANVRSDVEIGRSMEPAWGVA